VSPASCIDCGAVSDGATLAAGDCPECARHEHARAACTGDVACVAHWHHDGCRGEALDILVAQEAA